MLFSSFRIPDELMDFKLPELSGLNSDLLIREAESYLEYEPVYIPMSYYIDCMRNGERLKYSRPGWKKRRALGALLLGELYEKKGRFLDKIIDVTYSILEETTWTAPQHNAYVRDGEIYRLPDTRRPIIDLYAAETGASIAVAYAVLKPILKDKEYEFLFNLMEDEMNDRIWKPYLTDHFWWKGNGSEFINNWCTWCSMNVLLSFFLMPTTQRMRHDAFKEASYSMDCFLKDYGLDGCCSEGVGYYKKAGLCLMNNLHILNSVSGGLFEELYHDEKIENIFSFILDMHVDEDWYFNYADCSAKPGRAGVREFMAGKLIGSDSLMSFARMQYEESSEREKYYLDEMNIYFRFLACSLDKEISSYGIHTIEKRDRYFSSNGVAVAHRGRYSLSVKGGDNGDSHNHNDVGSIILYKDGKPFLVDVGVGTYTVISFTERRYEIWSLRSTYHNTLNFEGVEEKPGSDHGAENMSVSFKDDVNVDMDLEKAYGSSEIRSYSRSISFGDDGLLVDDKADTALIRKLTLMTAMPLLPVDESTLEIESLGRISFNVPFFSRDVEEIPVTDEKLEASWGKGSVLYRTVLSFDEDFSWTVR